MNKNKKATPTRVTAPSLIRMKKTGQKITMLTAYDFSMARLLDQAGVDVILVGDSMAMVVQGHENTLPVTLDEMIYHAEMVGRATRRALIVVDLPFPTNHLGVHRAVAAAGRVLKETHCHAIKLEGGADQADVISALVTAGIPVMAHVGLRPQTVHTMGGYRVQRDKDQLLRDAQVAQDSGAFSVVMECMSASIATEITELLSIPTIGIGAGAGCDGQVLVTHDILGMTSGYVPSFVKQYADLNQIITDAAKAWCDDVREAEFPGPEQSFD